MSGGSIRNEIEKSIREVVFGLEDSFVSTLGAVTGIAAGVQDSFVVILSGLVLIFVEALSMSAGSYLSSKSVQEISDKRIKQDSARILQERLDDQENLKDFLLRKKINKKDQKTIMNALMRERKLWIKEITEIKQLCMPGSSQSSIRAGVVMGMFYLLGGVLPIAPYFVLPVEQAILPSIILTGVGLFALGAFKGRFVGGKPFRSAMEMVLISLTAAGLGFLIGRLVAVLLGI